MRIWFDTEFIEDGRTIDLISIGAAREDGETFYAESCECDLSKASPWVVTNVIPNLSGQRKSRAIIAFELVDFMGVTPEIWAYYADYDWVVLCQLFGTMMDLPSGWPKYCRDIKQMCDDLGNPRLPKQESSEHNALADALWNKKSWEYLVDLRDMRNAK